MVKWFRPWPLQVLFVYLLVSKVHFIFIDMYLCVGVSLNMCYMSVCAHVSQEKEFKFPGAGVKLSPIGVENQTQVLFFCCCSCWFLYFECAHTHTHAPTRACLCRHMCTLVMQRFCIHVEVREQLEKLILSLHPVRRIELRVLSLAARAFTHWATWQSPFSSITE